MDRIPIGTTPTLYIDMTGTDGLDLTAAAHVYMTVTGAVEITKKDSELTITEQTVGMPLTQRETLQLGKGAVYARANWTYADGKRDASNAVLFMFTDNQPRRMVD